MTEPFPPTRRAVMAALVSIVAAAGVLLSTETAHGIIGGQLDGNAHPYVAAVGPPKPIVASGVLISPTVVLTAAHVAARRLGPGAARVTFDSDATSSTAVWHTGTAYTHPAWDPLRADNPNDLAVIVLDAPVTGVTPAALPTAGLLDELGPQGLRALDFEVVGFGISRAVGGAEGGGQPDIDRTSGGIRKVLGLDFAGLTAAWFNYLEDPDGSTCSGDSGAPVLFGGSNQVVATNVRGDAACKSFGQAMRVDTPEARAFLGQFVALP